MANQLVIQTEIDYLHHPIDVSHRYIHRWRRDHIARLLTLFIEDQKFKEKLIESSTMAEEDLLSLTAQLEREREQMDESARVMEEERQKFEEEMKRLAKENLKLRRFLNEMIRYVLLVLLKGSYFASANSVDMKVCERPGMYFLRLATQERVQN